MHRILDWLSGRPYLLLTLLLTLTMLMWGGNAVAGRLAVGEVSPMALTGLRWVVPPLEPGSNRAGLCPASNPPVLPEGKLDRRLSGKKPPPDGSGMASGA